MMSYADEQSYEEMISALQNFKNQVEEQCNVMEKAGKDCIDNTDGDPAAEKSSARLSECVGKIRATFEIVDYIISALQEEIEDIRAAAAAADQID